MSEIAVALQPSLLSYIVGSVTVPRATVRQLMADPQLKSVGWQLVLIAATVSTLSGVFAGLYEYLYNKDSFETTFFPADYPLADTLLWSAIGFGLFIFSFLLIRFLWSYLFGYRDAPKAVWAAAVMSCCPLIILDPLFELVMLTQAANADAVSVFTVSGAYLLIFSLFAAAYFSAALVISILKAFVLFVCAALIAIVAVVALFFGTIGIPTIFLMQASS